MLWQIAEQPRITGREISMNIGITDKATHRIITDPEGDGYVTKKREGRRLRYRVNPDLPIRAETQRDKAVSGLLEVVAWKRPRKPMRSKTGCQI